ncbi:YisL family protein [Bacillus sp. 165]|uniref:YisL family protein n=1 Tax=Bacillus sp. 165 TaxID=1529117 RepID=UPI001ADC9319|nr:YisL family protein [Bacillus sp. 165]MBO9128694.1 YisL family protein [Bacillus sp. 165]
MIHAHITAWLIGIILFFVAVSMYKNGNSKAKIVHMVLRLFFILIVLSGVMLYMSLELTSSMHMWYGMKALAGILIIGFMEMVLVRTKKEKNTKVSWFLFFVALVAVFYLGFKLPLNIHIFS